MNKTDIDWTDFTWNPVTGCLHGCLYCYARSKAKRIYPAEIGFSPHFWPERLGEPGRRRKPAKIFVTSMGDLFGDWVFQEWWNEVFRVVKDCPQHTFQFLTKNPRRLRELNPWPDNCRAGVTATDQRMFDVAVRHLKEVDVRTKFVSAEPLLGPIRMEEDPGLDWLIIGAQTGRRPMQPINSWVDDLVADAQKWGIKIFCKDNLEGYSIREWPLGMTGRTRGIKVERPQHGVFQRREERGLAMNISQIKTRAPFNGLFPIDPSILSAIKARIDAHGYDESQPIVIWEEEAVVVDGHSRLQAAMDLGLEEVPVHMKSFPDEDGALEYAIHNQRHRRNLTEAELLRCIEAVDKRLDHGGDRRSEDFKAQPCAMKKSSEQTAKIVGVSARKVEQARTVLAEPQAAAEVKAGKRKIGRAYQEIQANRKNQSQSEPAKNQDSERRAILKKALTEIQRWRERYKDYPEFSAILKAIDGCCLNLERMEMLAKADGPHHPDVESDSLEPSPSVFVREDSQLPDTGNDGLPSNSDEVEIDGQFADLSESEGVGPNFKDCRNCSKVIISLDAPDQGSCEIYSTPRPIGNLVSCPHFEFQVAADPSGPTQGIPAKLEVSQPAKASTGEGISPRP